MNIRDLTNKVANNGANVNGKLTAEEYNVLITQVKNMSNGAVYMGVATPTTTPQTFDGNVELVYLATTAGKYTAFGNIVVNDAEICALRWRYSAGWGKEVITTRFTTPSGDPMHYAYIDAGATWSSSTGYWSLNGLTDITNEQIRKIHNFGFINDLSHCVFMGKMAKIRTNYLRVGNSNYNSVLYPIESLAQANATIEVITLRDTNGGYESVISAQNFNNAFYGCTKLREIHGRLQTSAIMPNTFSGCGSLQRVRIYKLVANVSFKDCPNIDKDSILYTINNSAATSAITIRLHADAYAKYSVDADVQAALASKTYVTLISA